MDPLVGLAILVLGVLTLIFYVVIPFDMAVRRKRSGILWVFISVAISPILAILILAVIGRA